jgi:hypothetical protein
VVVTEGGRHMGNVVGLICYPVKGCAGTSTSDALLTPAGRAHDRSFMVISGGGVFRTQRRHPRLGLIRPAVAVAVDGTRLTFGAGDDTDRIGTLCPEVATSVPRRDVDLFFTHQATGMTGAVTQSGVPPWRRARGAAMPSWGAPSGPALTLVRRRTARRSGSA